MNNEQIQVFAAPLPFSNKQVRAFAAPGNSIAQIIKEVCPIFHDGMGALVEINGHAIPREYWPVVRPKMGTLVNVRIVPGKGGKKSPIVSLLSIAIMVAAPYMSAAILGPTLAATQIGIGALTYGGVLSAAIGVVGRLALSALAPPPKPSNAGVGNVSNPASSPTQFIEGARNSISPYGVVPGNLGTNRMFPLQAVRPFTESQDNEQYVRQLMTYGFGPKMVIQPPNIGDTPVSEFTEFELEHRLEGDLHLGTALISNDVYQEDFNVLIKQVDGFTTRSTRIDSDEAIVDITFPRGLTAYDSENGTRNQHSVQLELQYALSGVSPQSWSPGATTFKAFAGGNVTFPEVQFGENYFGGPTPTVMTRTDIIYIDKFSGVIAVARGNESAVPYNGIRLASVLVTTTRNPSFGTLTTDIAVTDIRQPSWYGVTLENSSSFVPARVNASTASISAGGVLINDLDLRMAQSEAVRKSIRVVFPTQGQYDIRVRRITADSNSDQIFDDAFLTAIKSVSYRSPVNLEGINGTAIRIKATDQLNGALDQYNSVVSTVIPDYDPQLDAWVDRITSNPASIYRYVLQGPLNARPLADSKINLDDLEDWHIHCTAQGYTYNRVIDYDTSVDEVLRDVASAGAASPAIVDGKRTIAIDRVKPDIVQLVTPRNSWGYSGEMLYPDLPHAFRVQFRNADKGYIQDERIVYDDGYNEGNATKFEVLELQSCTNADLAFKTGRRHIAAARLRPEKHTFTMDVENIVFLRGDRIKFINDAPLIGVGDARIKTVTTTGGSPNLVKGITIDDTVTVPTSGMYYVRIRLADGTQLYKEIVAPVGDHKAFDFITPFSLADTPAKGDLCAFVEAGMEMDLIITRIEPDKDLAARIEAINYAPEIFTAEAADIPPFNSNITVPLELIRPEAPVLVESQSDESVMIVNPDGSYTTRAIFTLQNLNEGDIQTLVKIRQSGTSKFNDANTLESTPERLVITGLQSGTRYDIHIRHKRSGSSVMSLPLQLNSFLYVGTSGLPTDPTGFLLDVSGETALFKVDSNTDIDFSHFEYRYSGAFFGAAWDTSQLLAERVFENRLSVPFTGGTYFIKAVDRSGNYSENAATIITYNPGLLADAVAFIEEQPDWLGVMDNVTPMGTSIILGDATTDGYYYFDESLDLGGIFTSKVIANIQANGTYINDLFAITDLFAETDLFGAGGNDLFAITDLFAVDDLFGIGLNSWKVTLEYRVTNDDPTGAPVWTDWAELTAGYLEFWGIEFRLHLVSLAGGISPEITLATVLINMPDRIERGEDQAVSAASGLTVVYSPAFKANPSVVITIQDGDADDEIEYIGTKDETGFTFKVFNRGSMTYVDRICDYIVSGYGRKNT